VTVYPRDLIGYGRTPPDPQWPGGAVIAVQVVVNYEEGGESNILHGDATSEWLLSDIAGAQPFVGQRHMNMESLYEYGSRAGFWRLWRILGERQVPATVFAVATALQRHPEAAAAMAEAGWEIASHGLKWLEYKGFPEEEERRHIAEAIRLHAAITGERPLGFYQGKASVNTTRLVTEEGGFLYSSDSYADDLPYWISGPRGPHLIIPYALDTNDMRFATAPGYAAGNHFFRQLKDAFDVLYAEGENGAPKMMSVGLHCRLAGRPARAAGLIRFLDYVLEKERVWLPRRVDIARHWRKVHPAPAGAA
jgi:putative urate catabolism protein